MWRLITFLLFLIVSVWLGLTLVKHPGYLFISYQPWLVQMPIWFAILCLVVAFTLFYFFIVSLDQCHFLWFRLKNWLRLHREHTSYSKTQHGLCALIEGRYKKAEKLLISGANKSVEPLINYLSAAQAAQEQGAYLRRDEYLKQAYDVMPSAHLAIGLTQAELEIEQHTYAQASATLNHLRQTNPHHARILKLLEKVYVRLADWKSLYDILPSLRKAKLINSEQMEQFEKNIYCEVLNMTYKSHEELHRLWESIPRGIRRQPDVVYAYVKHLSKYSNTKEMENLIRKTLKRHWHAGLVKLYGSLPFSNLNRQLVIVGAWLKLYGQRPELLLTLGRLCVKGQLWGRAKDYFEKCLSLQPCPEASLAYGKLLEHLSEPEHAMQKYREGLTQVIAGNEMLLKS